jgi:hypothetical protein
MPESDSSDAGRERTAVAPMRIAAAAVSDRGNESRRIMAA